MADAYRTLGYARPQLILKSIDPAGLTCDSIATFPEIDYAGDFVTPDGGDWELEFKRNPIINLDHTEHVVARGEFKGLSPLEHAGETWQVPIVRSHFDPRDRLSAQVFRLVDDDVMSGVSLEFTPAPGETSCKSMGHRSPLENRDAMRFDRWIALGLAHTRQPVNPNARTLLPGVEKAIKAVETGKIGNEVLHEAILKSLAFGLPARAATVTVPRTVKAMDETAAPADAGDSGAPSGTPTANAAYDAAQGCIDLAAHVEDSLKGGEHVKGKKKLGKLIADLKSMAEECSSIGDMVSSEVSDDGDSDSEGGDEAPEPEEKSLTPVPLAFGEGNLIITKSTYKPKRFTLVGATLKAQADDTADIAALLKEADAYNRSAKSAMRRVERTTRRAWGRAAN